METGIKMSTEVLKDSAKNLGDLIDRVFTSAAKNRIEMQGVVKALDVISSTLSIRENAFTGCNIGDKTIQT